MRLSEAIRLGAMMNPIQAFDVYKNKATGGTCAMGAALDAVGQIQHVVKLGRDPRRHDIPKRLWPFAFVHATCPVCGPIQLSTSIVAHINNKHHWTRERIAEWVATVEPLEQSEPLEVAPTQGAVDVLPLVTVDVHARI
jgi:hypothetical protein